MGEVLQAYPSAQRALFRKYHIGGCNSCGYEISDLSPEAMNDLTARLTSGGIPFNLAVETFEPGQRRQILYAQMRYGPRIEAALGASRAM